MASPTVLESDTLVSSKKSKDRHLRKRDYDRDNESEEDYDVREPERSHEKKKSRSKVKDKSDRDKGRDGEGERGKSRGKDREREKGKDRDGEKVKESRHRDKEKHKEERAREKEKLREEREREKERLREEKERQKVEKERLREEKERLKEEKEHREREKEKARLKEEKELREKERLREEKEHREREKERLREEKEQREREKEKLRLEKEQREKERLREEKEQKEREKARLREERELRERLRQEKEREKERLRAEKEQQEREKEQKERELREEEEREKERLREEQEQREKQEREQKLREDKEKEKLKEQREKEKLRLDREREKKEEKDKLKEDRSKEKEKLREGKDREKERELDVSSGAGDKDRVARDREKKDRDRHREEKDRDRTKEREKEKHAEKHADREKDKGKDKGKKRRDRDKDKDREKEKHREREKERDEEDDRDRDRKRRKKEDDSDTKDKEKERERDKQKDRDKPDDEGGDRDRKRKRREEEIDKAEGKVKKDLEQEDPEEEQRKLDEEMEKRRRRVQEWQELRRRKEEEERKKRGEAEDVLEPDGNSKKTWTLEGEESDDEDLPKGEDAADAAPTDGDAAAVVSALENGDLMMIEAANVEVVSEAVVEIVPGIEPEGAPPPKPESDQLPDSEHTSPTTVKPTEEDDEDPLDAFMNMMIIPEVEKLNSMDHPPAEMGKSEFRLKDRGGMDNGKHFKRSSRNATGRIIPGEDSVSEDEREEGEGAAGDEEDDDFLKRVKKTKADKLAPVDHSKIQYPSFRKNFYIEVKEISRMHLDEVSLYRKELELKIRGKDVPRPIKTWNQTGLSSKALEVIKKSGFEKPMPIQTQALPIIMSGRDCIGIAKTGSGKTLAFVLPMLRHIMDQPPLSQGDGPIGLIMAPTRELVQQIYNDIKKFTKVLGLSCVPVYGGSGVAQQISDLKRGTEIVVCTPGRMIDILCTSAGKITNLRRVTYFVMDEADRMFDMGFEPQITRIVQNTRPDRQTVLFSATFPRQVEVLARKVLTKPIEIQVGGRSVVNRDITQTVEVRPDNERFLRLLELLGEWYEKGKILIFVHSQEKCDSLFRDLLKSGYPCLSLHGAKEQTDRESTIADFKRNVCNLMIATSVAARGLDVKELELVVNYDVPNHYEDYVHRVGRTGRAGRKGVAVTFISIEEERYAPDLVKALELSEQPVPDDLKKLADDFMAKVSQGTEQAHGSGYGGSGFKFNEEEDEARKAAKKAQAKEYGFEEDEDKSDSDSDDGTIRKQGGDLSEAAAQAAQAAALAAATKAAQPSTNPQFQAALLAAQAAASRSLQSSALTAGLGLQGMMPGLTGLTGMPGMMGGFVGLTGIPGMSAIGGMASLGISGFPSLTMAAAGTPAASAMGAAMGDGAARAAAYAAALNLQHNLAKIQADALPEHYEAELEINDFPQHARWKVTHKDALGQISEWTGAAITTRGQYFPTGKTPAPGERKLFLFIEGPTEASVKKAKAEIKRILEESTSAAISLPGSTQPGKYSVL